MQENIQEKSPIKQNILQYLATKGTTPYEFYKKSGVTRGVLNQNNGISEENIARFLAYAPDVNVEWLITGRGSMMGNNEKELTTQNINDGAPYYDVDFIGGFDEVFNDQTVNPELSITNGICPRAQLWCNITGHSMEPTISNGDIIALRQCSIDDIQYGEIYAVVMDSFRTVKMLRRSETPGMIRFVPVNTADFDPQDFPVKRILKIYEVVGCLRRFF